MKKIILTFLLGVCLFPIFSFAEDNWWTLIPEYSWEDVGSVVGKVWEKPWEVWKNYNTQAKKIDQNHDVWKAFATWIFSWNTIFDYFKYLAKLLSEIGLVIGALMIIYAGYKYATWVFTQDASKWGKDAIKWAIYGILIVIFSYAIMRILLAMFW